MQDTPRQIVTLYGLKNCDSCRHLARNLSQAEISFRLHDVRRDGLAPPLVQVWLSRFGAAALINRRSTTWRQLSDADKAAAQDDATAALLLRHPSLIKRPVVSINDATWLLAPAAEAVIKAVQTNQNAPSESPA